MTREEAFYERIKLLCGHLESYAPWLNTYLEIEEPLSEIVLDLIACGGNINDVLRCLNLYCLEKPFDEESVYTRLRAELCEQYEKGILTKDEVMSELYRISGVIPFCGFQNDCLGLSDYYVLAEEGVIVMDKFDPVFEKWLKHGGEIEYDAMWGS